MIRIGFIGTGEIANIHAECLTRMNNCSIVACYDIGLGSATSFSYKFGGNICSTSDEVIDNPNVDTVYICTHHDSHADLAISSLKKGKNVFLEKPLTLDSISAARVVAEYELSHSKMAIGFNMRTTPSIMRFKQLMKQHKVKVELFEASMASPPFMMGWACDEVLGGGVLACLGSHIFDLTTYILETPIIAINCVTKHIGVPNNVMPNCAIAIVKLKSGVLGSIMVHDRGCSGFHVEPQGKMAMITLFTGQGTFQAESYGKVRYSTGDNFFEEKFGGYDQCELWGYYEENLQFMRCLEGHKTNLSTVYEAQKIVNIVESAAKAAQSGSWVYL
ncbi:Inositol 2-dehydrogenase/D-chiro-inositol 3-dehydrogenase [subsurface metagenome]|nr:hypothetical protein [Clostridia bacterium]